MIVFGVVTMDEDGLLVGVILPGSELGLADEAVFWSASCLVCVSCSCRVVEAIGDGLISGLIVVLSFVLIFVLCVF